MAFLTRVLCLVMVLAGVLPSVFAQTTPSIKSLVLGVPQNTPDSAISAVVLREAYRRLGYKLEIRALPAERALLMSNEGDLDGESQRISGLSTSYPNLIQVLPAVSDIEI